MTSPTARPILERLAYVFYLVLLVGSIGVTWLGWMVGVETGNYTAMCIALGGLALTRWLHVHGHAHWHFQACEDSFEVHGAPGVIPRSEKEEQLAGEIENLFVQLETEQDVWTRGELRRQIARMLSAAPGLRAEFANKLAAHPEL